MEKTHLCLEDFAIGSSGATSEGATANGSGASEVATAKGSGASEVAAANGSDPNGSGAAFDAAKGSVVGAKGSEFSIICKI